VSKKKRPGRAVDPGSTETPRSRERVDDKPRPRSLDPVQALADKKPVWRTNSIDYDGPWGWRSVNAETILSDVVVRLHQYEDMAWGQFVGPRNHDVGLQSLCADARRRLRELGGDELDSLFSIRVDGKRRVWAKRKLNCLHILWWDPGHEVCPSHKKHT
jgi:hypothetical protein